MTLLFMAFGATKSEYVLALQCCLARSISVMLVCSIAFGITGCDNRKPQEPTGKETYQSEEVVFPSSVGSFKLAGTLTTPAEIKNQTVIILISGSGPNERDWKNMFGHRPALVLANYLTLQGFSVLRYDERGTGKSDGNYEAATFENLVDDVVGAMHYLKKGKGYSRIGLLGHSEGAQVASLATLQSPADFLILLSPAMSPTDEGLVYQTRSALVGMGIGEREVNEISATVDTMLTILKAERNTEISRAKLNAVVQERGRSASEEYMKAARRLGDPQNFIHGLYDPKFIYRLHHPPGESLKKVRVPVLAVFGGDDHTIDVDYSRRMIGSVLDSTSHEVRFFEGVNHLMMETNGISMERVHQIKETLSPAVLDAIRNWLSEVEKSKETGE